MIIAPVKLISAIKDVYLNNVTTLTFRFKSILLVILIILFLDNYWGMSHALWINTQIDSIEHLERISSPSDRGSLKVYKMHVVKAFLGRESFMSKAKELLNDNCDDRYHILRITTAGVLPFALFLFCLYYLCCAIIVKRENQIEHVVNLLLIIILVLSLLFLMLWLSDKLSQYLSLCSICTVSLLANVILYILLCVFVSSIVKTENS